MNLVGLSSCSGGGPSEAGGRSADKFNWWKISLPCCFHLTVSNNLPRTRCALTSFARFSAFCSLREKLPMLSYVQPNFPYENLGPRPSALEVAPLVLQIDGFESCYWPQGKLGTELLVARVTMESEDVRRVESIALPELCCNMPCHSPMYR